MAALVLASPAAAEKKRQARPFLLGGAVQPVKSPVRLDPVLPRGRLRGLELPLLMKQERCSLRRPVCVGANDELSSAELQQALALLIQAYEEHVFGAGLARPIASSEQPLMWALDDSKDLQLLASRLPSRGFDRARAACVGGLHSLESARRCVTEAGLAAVAPATASWLSAGLGAHTARALGPAPVTDVAIAESFARPGVGVLSSRVADVEWRDDRRVPVSRLRSARFFDYLESRSVARLGKASWLSLSLAATRTPWGAPRFEAEPDLLDVLLATVGADVTELARLLDDFAQYSFHDARERGLELALGWTLPGRTLPRNVALPHVLEPTGSGYLKVDLTQEQSAQLMALKMSCEAPVSYVWSVARLDEEGEEMSRVPVAYRHRGRSSATRVEPEEGTRSLLVVGTNMGGIDMAHPFDPDHAPHESHACSVYVSELPTDGTAPAKD